MRIGLTGGIASGKSTVSAMLAEHGAYVIDADQLAREAVAPGTAGLAAVVEEFGEQVLDADGAMDRPAVGRIVFGDEDARRRLEAIIHPRVRALGAEKARMRTDSDPGALVVHDIPLLVETGQAGDFDAVLVVDVDEATQVRRMVENRGWTEDEARSRIAAQASREERLAAATHVIDNSGTYDDLRHRVTEVVAELQGRH
ncbi:dephospho-CoA kinase, long form [Nocardioidaceae bacterium]|nr:dephospho-CoA kinase, long form [Nocardioidaceae bacterium]